MSISELLRHRELYYNGNPEISDEQYDALEHRLRDEGVDVDGVGISVSGLFDDVQHQYPMLSLAKAHTPEDLEDFLKRFGDEKFLVGPKFDGVSIALHFEDGKLVRAVTRGDGVTGEDVTQNIAPWVPGTIPLNGSLEVRGEMLMLKSDFDKVSEELGFANPRNAASGTVRKKTIDERRKLKFMPFDVAGVEGDIPDILDSIGFPMTRFEVVEKVGIIPYIKQLEVDRNSLDFEVDGAVIKVADRGQFEALGSTSHHPRGALAYKLTPEVQVTTLNSVTWQVGKSGTVAPVGEVAPVLVAGTTISRVSLHNLSVIDEKDLKIGDTVQIKRAGDVIPHIIGPLVKQRKNHEQPIVPPGSCPSCEGSLTETGESRILVCENINCPAQASRRIQHWASRAAADIDALGEKLIQIMYDQGLVTRISDLYRLDTGDLLNLERMGEKRAANVISSIEKSKQVGMRKALIGFSIPLASEGTAKRLQKAGYENIERVMDATAENLEKIDDIGPQVAHSIVAFFGSADTIEEIRFLRDLGVNLDAEKVEAVESALTGKRVCITGTLSMKRDEFKAILESMGAEVTGSVSKTTDILVCGENAGSKRKKAESLGVTILSEKDALGA